jgi:hypothetical protein
VKVSKQKAPAFALVVFATLSGDARGQNQFDTISAEESNPLLMRVQQIKDGEFSCLLLRRDNSFHLEYAAGDRVNIHEGALSEAASSALQALLANQSLATLSQERIREPLVSAERPAQLALNLHRAPGPAGWQNLLFRTAESQRDFKAEISPFLKWVDFLRKQPHKSLTEEEGRNQCRLGKIQLKARPGNESFIPFSQTASRQESAPFLFRTVIHQTYSRNFGNGISLEDRVELTCVIVYPGGRYHLETASQRIRESERRSVFEATLSEAELSGLRQLLDEPGLVASSHRMRPPAVPVHEIDFTAVFIARPGGIQSLNFGTFSVFRGHQASEKSDTDEDTAVIQPVRNWIQKNLEKRGVPANAQAVTNNCEPQR